jgi:hypothetical protein
MKTKMKSLSRSIMFATMAIGALGYLLVSDHSLKVRAALAFLNPSNTSVKERLSKSPGLPSLQSQASTNNTSSAPIEGKFYKYFVIARTGQDVGGATLERIEPGVSLNDKGEVAFAASFRTPTGSNSGIFVGDGTAAPRIISGGLQAREGNEIRNFEGPVQINNDSRVIAYQRVVGGTELDIANISVWPNRTLQDMIGCQGGPTAYCSFTELSKYTSITYGYRIKDPSSQERLLSHIFGSLGIAGNAPRCCGLGAWLKLWQAEVEQILF